MRRLCVWCAWSETTTLIRERQGDSIGVREVHSSRKGEVEDELQCVGLYWICIQKCIALSPWLFAKATEMTSGVSKSVPPVSNVEIMSLS